ncbi:MAG: GNAT family N-acetyltransferase, partial [Actinomycetia bacterium]|nr:GNAT family N-acetyltransferase [Actinomycetes bacterium]
WLQVETDNVSARALYAGLGFGAHHAYHHYREPEGALGADPEGRAVAGPGPVV